MANTFVPNYGNMRQQQPYPQYPQQPMYQQQYQPQQSVTNQDAFNVRSVSSREEAVAVPVDFMRPTIILGLNHGMVYVKQFNQETGETVFLPFVYAPEKAASPQYVTVEMFEEFKKSLKRSKKKEVSENVEQ